MKAILILCLIATLNCNIVDTAFCLIGNEKIRATFTDVVSAIKEKDWNKIFTTIVLNLSDIIDIVRECVTPEKNDDKGEVVLQGRDNSKCKNCVQIIRSDDGKFYANTLVHIKPTSNSKKQHAVMI